MAIIVMDSLAILDATTDGRALITAASKAVARAVLELDSGDSPTFAAMTITGIVSSTSSQFNSNVMNTPTGTTQTITLDNGNLQTLDLTSSTGNVAVTLTVPSEPSSGRIKVVQHASVVRDLTISASAGSLLWLGGEPDWINEDSINDIRAITWSFDGTDMLIAVTEVAS